MKTKQQKKLNATELNQLIGKLIKEAKSSSELKELLPSSDEELITYASKVDDLLEKFAKEAEELRLEGAELVSKDILGSAKVGERNRFVMARVGLILKLKNLMVQGLEALKRET